MNKRLSRSELLFFAAYILWLVFAVIKLTYLKDLMPYKTINGYVEKVVILLLFAKFLDDDKYGMKGILGILVVGILYYVSIQSNAPGILIPIYFIFSARNVDYRDIFKVTLVIQLGVMAVSVVCSLRSIIPNDIWDAETRARYSLGYTFCTYGSHISFFMTLIYMSIRKKINLLETLGLVLWNFAWYEITNTRIDLLLSLPAIIGCYILGKIEFKFLNSQLCKIGLMAAGPVMAAVSIAGQWFYQSGNDNWWRIDNRLNGRLSLGNQAINTYGITAFGQYIKWVGRGGIKKHPDWVYNYVDCSYLKILLHYGLVFFVLLMLGIMIVGNYCAKEKNIGLGVAYIFWIVYGMVDAELFELAFQPFMLLLGIPFCEKCFRAGEKNEIRK